MLAKVAEPAEGDFAEIAEADIPSRPGRGGASLAYFYLVASLYFSWVYYEASEHELKQHEGVTLPAMLGCAKHHTFRPS